MRNSLVACFVAVVVLAAPAVTRASHTVTRWHDNHGAAVSVTFDDGLLTHVTVAAPLLDARGYKGTFFVLTDDGWNEWPGYWQDWQMLAVQGHEIASHTVTHAHLPQLTETVLRQELSQSRAAVDFNITGQKCLTLAYPFGEQNAFVEDVTSEYYIAARDVWSMGYLNLYPEDVTGNYTAVSFYALGSYSFDYPSLTTFAKLSGYLDDAELTGGWFMPHIHDLSASAASLLLTQFLDELMVRDVWVDTMANVVRYMQERMLSTLTVVSETPTAITLSLAGILDPAIYTVPLTLRSTVPASWSGISVVQGGSVQSVLSVLEGAETVVYYHAVPNGGNITLTPGVVANQAPVVNAGPDKSITLPESSVIIDATVTDDGLPLVPGKVAVTWSKASGPGSVSFVNAFAIDTGVSFSVSGTYVLQLVANDGALSSADTMTVVVNPAGPLSLDVAVKASNCDAEEAINGTVTLNSSDLELVYDSYKSAGNQTVGLRFAGLTIPKDATITNAYVQFTVDEPTSTALTLTLRAQAADNAAVFTTAKSNISSRAKTAAQVSWSPAAWTVVGQAGTAQRTSNIATLVQEVVSRPGWASGNALVLIVTESQQRVAVAYDLNATQAPVLHVEYAVGGGPTNLAPVVEAGPDRSVLLPLNTVGLSGSVADDGLPNPPAAVTVQWSKVSGPGTVTFQSAAALATNATFSSAGAYVLMLTASDSAASSSDTLTVSVQGASTTVVDVAVAASAADVEEAASGTMYIDSSDLELVYDSYNSAGNQTVGMRFAGVAVPPGATITAAYIQFKTDEVTANATSLVVRGEAADNAAVFTTAKSNASSRAKTTAQASWTPAVWATVGEAGAAQRTPDLSAVVQEIVSRPGWLNGNAMVFLVTGTGTRTAVAYEASPKDAPKLHIEYTLAKLVTR
jgi:peptidoglycan/xylan/chitin deacetylase (PgdA/CDA1 family)